jgi:hypothetical protein
MSLQFPIPSQCASTSCVTVNPTTPPTAAIAIANASQGIIVPNSGQWIPEEQPDFVVKLLNNFFSGKPAKTK